MNTLTRENDFFTKLGAILADYHGSHYIDPDPEATYIDKGALSFGRYLRAARLNAQWSELELAERADISEAEVFALERGLILSTKIKSQTLRALAKALDDDIDIFALLLDREIAKPDQPVSVIRLRNDWRAASAYLGSGKYAGLLLALMSVALGLALLFALLAALGVFTEHPPTRRYDELPTVTSANPPGQWIVFRQQAGNEISNPAPIQALPASEFLSSEGNNLSIMVLLLFLLTWVVIALGDIPLRLAPFVHRWLRSWMYVSAASMLAVVLLLGLHTTISEVRGNETLVAQSAVALNGVAIPVGPTHSEIETLPQWNPPFSKLYGSGKSIERNSLENAFVYTGQPPSVSNNSEANSGPAAIPVESGNVQKNPDAVHIDTLRALVQETGHYALYLFDDYLARVIKGALQMEVCSPLTTPGNMKISSIAQLYTNGALVAQDVARLTDVPCINLNQLQLFEGAVLEKIVQPKVLRLSAPLPEYSDWKTIRYSYSGTEGQFQLAFSDIDGTDNTNMQLTNLFGEPKQPRILVTGNGLNFPGIIVFDREKGFVQTTNTYGAQIALDYQGYLLPVGNRNEQYLDPWWLRTSQYADSAIGLYSLSEQSMDVGEVWGASRKRFAVSPNTQNLGVILYTASGEFTTLDNYPQWRHANMNDSGYPLGTGWGYDTQVETKFLTAIQDLGVYTYKQLLRQVFDIVLNRKPAASLNRNIEPCTLPSSTQCQEENASAQPVVNPPDVPVSLVQVADLSNRISNFGTDNTIHFAKSEILEIVIKANTLSSDIMAIGAGYAHTCAVLPQGEVTCWNDNAYEQVRSERVADLQEDSAEVYRLAWTRRSKADLNLRSLAYQPGDTDLSPNHFSDIAETDRAPQSPDVPNAQDTFSTLPSSKETSWSDVLYALTRCLLILLQFSLIGHMAIREGKIQLALTRVKNAYLGVPRHTS